MRPSAPTPGRRRARRPGDERGAAVVDFVLALVVLLPLVLGLLQLGLVLHVRNTLAAAASEGARYAATYDHEAADGAARTRSQVAGVLAARFTQDVSVSPATVAGAPGWVVEVRAEVPPLGLAGPAVAVAVRGSAVEEVLP